jgi:hypothetical protein
MEFDSVGVPYTELNPVTFCARRFEPYALSLLSQNFEYAVCGPPIFESISDLVRGAARKGHVVIVRGPARGWSVWDPQLGAASASLSKVTLYLENLNRRGTVHLAGHWRTKWVCSVRGCRSRGLAAQLATMHVTVER